MVVGSAPEFASADLHRQVDSIVCDDRFAFDIRKVLLESAAVLGLGEASHGPGRIGMERPPKAVRVKGIGVCPGVLAGEIVPSETASRQEMSATSVAHVRREHDQRRPAGLVRRRGATKRTNT